MSTPLLVEIKRVSADDTHRLRHAVLRAHQSMREMDYPGDREPESAHFAAVVEGRTIGVASVYRQPPPGTAELKGAEGLWRVRGMAVEEPARGRGVGAALLAACVDHADVSGGDVVWCNARCAAKGFYLGQGFQPRGAEFDIMGLGPHVLMARRLPRRKGGRRSSEAVGSTDRG